MSIRIAAFLFLAGVIVQQALTSCCFAETSKISACSDDDTSCRPAIPIPVAVMPQQQPQPAKSVLREVTATSEVKQVLYSIGLIEDSEGNLAEYESLQKDGIFFADSQTLQPALRIMRKNKLIRQLHSPRIACVAGERANFQVNGNQSSKDKESWQGIRVQLAADEKDNGLQLSISLEAREKEHRYVVDTSVFLEPNQSVVLSANRGPSIRTADNEKPPVYLVLTPELVK